VSPRGSWDEFCTFCTLHCGKCSGPLGRKYVATTAGLSRLQDRLTVDIDKMLVYQHGVEEPGLPVAERAEVIRLLHPEQDDVAHWVQACMSLCVVLKEEQNDIVRGLKRLADVVGAEAGLEAMGESGGQTLARLPDGTRVLERLEILERKVAAMSGDSQRKVEKPGKLEALEKNLEGLEKRLGNHETLQKGMERIAALEKELNTLKRAGCQGVTQAAQDHDNESVAGKALSAEPANNSAKKLKRKRVADVMIESPHASAELEALGLDSSSDTRKQLGGKVPDPQNSNEGDPEPERHIRNRKSGGRDPGSSYRDVSDDEYREHPARHREPKRRSAAFEIPIGKDAGRRSTRTGGQGLGPAAKEERPRRSTNHRR